MISAIIYRPRIDVAYLFADLDIDDGIIDIQDAQRIGLRSFV
jgi:2-methylaconitate cis-trans-isomerase PrpF